jgi:hypothetical protein
MNRSRWGNLAHTMLRATLALLGVLWGVQFLVFRAWWTRTLAATNWGGAPEWLPRLFPYIGAATGLVWAIVMATTGLFGTY